MTVAIFGNTDWFEEHELVQQAVEQRSEETFVVEVQRWPGNGPIEHSVGSGQCIFDKSISFDEVTGVFSMIQTIFPMQTPNYEWFDRKPERPAYKQLREWQQTFWSVIAIFEVHGAKTMVSPTDRYWNLHRPWMLELYDSNDIPVPDTTFTNDPKRVKEFVENHSRAVIQPVNGGMGLELICASDLDPERLKKLSAAPIKLQEYVPGDDTRGYVIDGQLVGMIKYEHDSDAFSIKSPEVDYSDIRSIPFSPDSDLREAIVRAGNLAPSAYAAVDARLTEDGDFTILESNTPGRFAAHDLAGSTDISGHIAEYLMG
jgi:hypothetical protein